MENITIDLKSLDITNKFHRPYIYCIMKLNDIQFELNSLKNVKIENEISILNFCAEMLDDLYKSHREFIYHKDFVNPIRNIKNKIRNKVRSYEKFNK